MDTVAEVIQEPVFPGWKTEPIIRDSFRKVGRIAMCNEGLEIHPDLDERGFILLSEDIDAVLDGEKGILADRHEKPGRVRQVIDLGSGVEYFDFPALLYSSITVGFGGAGWQE